MKKKIFILPGIIFLFLFACSDNSNNIKSDRIHSGKQILELFENPPAEYRTVPFWVWNEKVSKKMIDDQLPQFKENGFGGVFVHPRYGLITEYASDDWYELVAYSVKNA